MKKQFTAKTLSHVPKRRVVMISDALWESMTWDSSKDAESGGEMNRSEWICFCLQKFDSRRLLDGN